MTIRNAWGAVLAIAAAVVGLGTPGTAAASPAGSTCAVQTLNTGTYLTAVRGGGQVIDVIHSDATRIDAWERFTFVDAGDQHYGLRTANGNYVTAVRGGGQVVDVVHTDGTTLRGWETFSLVPTGADRYAIRTFDGHYLTAIGGGGRVTDVLHTDATTISTWEQFRLVCGV
ncbi:hypothetical protein [Actinosynnema sp. NPDC020468]|uniref:fascin domain-containing protein n=1 Tax=Actinosynnema sp. NPDC020468 TaxID=3154488 RepID=UPI0033F6DEC7